MWVNVFQLNRNVILQLLTIGSQSQLTPRCPRDVCAIFSFLSSPHADTHFFKRRSLDYRDGAVGRAATSGSRRPHASVCWRHWKSQGSEVAWRNPERLKLRFLPLTANTVGRAFRLAPNPPSKRPCCPYERGIMAELAVTAMIFAHLQAAVFFSPCFALSRGAKGESKGCVNGSRQASGASPSHLALVLDRENYLVAHQNNPDTSFVLRPQWQRREWLEWAFWSASALAPGPTLEGCGTLVAKPHFNMKNHFSGSDVAVMGKRNSSSPVYSSINLPQ